MVCFIVVCVIVVILYLSEDLLDSLTHIPYGFLNWHWGKYRIMLYWTTLSLDWTVKFDKNVCSTCHVMTKSLFNLSYYDQFKCGMTTVWFNIHIVWSLRAFNLNKLYIWMNYHHFIIFYQVSYECEYLLPLLGCQNEELIFIFFSICIFNW